MKAIVVEKHGGPEVLQVQQAAEPKPGRGQARIKLAAAGVNFIDIYQRRGQYAIDLPYTPGQEGAGTVDMVGEGVSEVKVGDRVAYTSTPCSYAQYCVINADRLIPIPPGISFERAAAVPLQGMTAHYLLHEFRTLKRGDVVLIHAAAGGMGLLLVQWAKHLGARVIGTVSTEAKAELASAAGAQDVIIYTRENFAERVKQLTNGHGADLVIDGVGKSTFAGSLDAATVKGTVVIYGSASGAAEPIAPNSLQSKSLTVCGGALYNFIRTREEMLLRANEVFNGLQQGWLKLTLLQVLPLAEAAAAHDLLESRKTTGKLVLKID